VEWFDEQLGELNGIIPSAFGGRHRVGFGAGPFLPGQLSAGSLGAGLAFPVFL